MSRNEWPPKRPGDAPPKLDRLRVLWRVQATSGRIWECALYQPSAGRELRLEPEGVEDGAAMTLLLRSEADLGPTSEAWRAAALAKGFTAVRN